MQPRSLRLLRIDDDLERLEQPEFPHLEPVTVRIGGHDRMGISSWERAIEYWKDAALKKSIDLIVADVRFKDETTPLAELAARLANPSLEALQLPTGLSHLKAFAATARAKASPIGVGIHTAQPGTWKGLLSSDEPIHYVLALLAAHEIGELAAILGQGDEIEVGHNRLESCWNWLGRNSEFDWSPAVCVALRNFRKSLKGRSVPPREWLKLVKWCQEMQTAPQPLAANDCGLPIMLGGDGLDRISFCSLFADVRRERTFRFDIEPLPAKCFEIEPNEEYFLLDSERLPRIGSLISELGGLASAYPEALNILESFSPPASGSPPRTSLENLIKNGHHELPAAIAIVLMSIRREHEYFREWEKAYSSYLFDARKCVFDPNERAVKGKALADLAQTCLDVIRAKNLDEPSSEDVRETLGSKVPGISKATFDLLIELLSSLDWLEKPTSEGLLKVRRPRKGEQRAKQLHSSVPRVPQSETKLLESLLLDEIYFGSRFHFLAVAFGDRDKYEHYYGMTPRARKDLNTNDLGRALARGFERKAAVKNQTPKRGRDLLDDLWEGDTRIPGLDQVCRMFAEEELRWAPSSSWPNWLRSVAGLNKEQS